MPDAEVKGYVEKLKLWALGAVTIIAMSIATALANKFLGVQPQLPAPPVIIVQPGGSGAAPVVQVLETKGK